MFEDACKHINLDELEQKQAFRIANQAVNKAELQVKTQSRAIYGRTMTTASEVSAPSRLSVLAKSLEV